MQLLHGYKYSITKSSVRVAGEQTYYIYVFDGKRDEIIQKLKNADWNPTKAVNGIDCNGILV